MISREDYIFTVGFSGNTAIVSKSMKARYRRHTAVQLVEKGFFKAAVNMACYDNAQDALERILQIYNEHNSYTLDGSTQLKRIFGVLESLEDIDRVLY
ncbi:MAG: hypothetical protein EHM28_14985, partial [Spirochaetaceae bacterium]